VISLRIWKNDKIAASQKFDRRAYFPNYPAALAGNCLYDLPSKKYRLLEQGEGGCIVITMHRQHKKWRNSSPRGNAFASLRLLLLPAWLLTQTLKGAVLDK
jgi:hypothetical protein